jgi:hypothetical protein
MPERRSPPALNKESFMRSFLGIPRTVCSCDRCAVNCRFIPGYLLPEDLTGIARFLGHSDIMTFAMENLLASPGALVSKGGRIQRIRTIVPARSESGWCKFFDGRLCTIHPVAPFGCAFFDSHQDPGLSHVLSALGLTYIASQWGIKGGYFYGEVWLHLHSAGLHASPPEESRRQMQEGMI